ncbi:MAG: response regulator [Elusimicrobia bacterium]|nr:response regulator [Elusimicrobiota bacterium]
MTRILVVDDEFQMRELMKAYLENAGYVVDVAEHGKEALEKLRKESFDLVILDLSMPEVGGLDVLKILRNNPKHRRLPVLMCTSSSVTREVDSVFEAGANGYLVKSMFDEKKIVEKVKSVLPKPT